MFAWIVLITISSVIGVLTERYIKTKLAFIFAAIIPFALFSAAVLYEVYFIPYQGGGASMWPVAIVFGGAAAAVTGLVAFTLTKVISTKRHSPSAS